MPEFITIARIAKTQGVRGEVACDLQTDFPEKFAERKRLYALDARNQRRELHVEDHWPHKGRVVLKFAGVDSMNDAELLLGSEIQIPLAERAQLEPGRAYISDLLGCTVINATLAGSEVRGDPAGIDHDSAVHGGEPGAFDHGGALVGVITNVQLDSGDAPLLTVSHGKDEYLVPFAQAYIKEFDIARKRLEMNLPPGLLEANTEPAAKPQKVRKARPKKSPAAGAAGQTDQGQ